VQVRLQICTCIHTRKQISRTKCASQPSKLSALHVWMQIQCILTCNYFCKCACKFFCIHTFTRTHRHRQRVSECCNQRPVSTASMNANTFMLIHTYFCKCACKHPHTHTHPLLAFGCWSQRFVYTASMNAGTFLLIYTYFGLCTCKYTHP